MALSLVCEKEKVQLKEIEELINKKLEIFETDGFSLTSDKTPTNRKVKKELKKNGVNLKKAKELAEKMMGKKGMSDSETSNRKKPGGQKPTNKRHF
jgi:hypothetical protein